MAAISLCCAVAAGCGSSSSGSVTRSVTSRPARPAPLATRECAGARRAAASLLGGAVTMKIADADPGNVECVLRGPGGTRVDMISQATAQAWNEWDTTQVHQVQAYGSGGLHEPGQIPQIVPAHGLLAAWIPAQRMLFATDGTQSRGGSYVTVTVTRGHLRATARRRLARAVALGVLAAAPKGPTLVPPT